jgi:heat shock protein HslJ
MQIYMNKKTIIPLVLVIFVLLLVTLFVDSPSKKNPPTAGAINEKNATYIIEGTSVTLVNGMAEQKQADSETTVVTQYFGNELRKDLNNDGREDVVFLLTQQPGGTGTFFYAVASLNTENGYVGSHGIFLGDRIAPQTTESGKNNIVVVNYADRKPEEPFTAQPSVGKSIWLLLDPSTMQFGEVAQNFEGEADPSKMTLIMKKWDWISTTYKDKTVIKPKTAGKFSLTFAMNKGYFSATTDCNSISGYYLPGKDNSLKFSEMMSTLMYCEGSQEGEFSQMLTNTESYGFTSNGELILNLKDNGGSAIFR